MSVCEEAWERGQAKGASEERERIIKLLEEELGDGDWVIALIKGSQNVGAEIDNPSEGENK